MDVKRMRVELRNSRYDRVWHKTVDKMTDGEVIKEFYEMLNRKFDNELKDTFALQESIFKDIQFTSGRVPTTNNVVQGKKTVGISIPYEDVELFGQIICKKEEILTKWKDMIGKELDVDWDGDGRYKTVTGVKVVGDYIAIDLK